MTRIFVFEYLSAGGLAGDDDDDAALLAQGLAMRDAIVADLLQAGHEITVAACEATLRVPRGAAAVRARPGESLPAFVAREAERHDAAWIVAPETEGCLAAFERVVPASRWLGCNAAAIAVASSKSATLARLAAQGIATPLAFGDEAQRWVVKPDDGAGACRTRVHGTRAAAQAALALQPGACLEPWVEGEAGSLSLLAGRDGSIELLSVNRQHIRLHDDGTVTYDGVQIDTLPATDARRRMLAALARRVASALPGLAGFVGIDFVWHAERGPVVIELNPRPTCAYVGLSARLRRNLGAEIVAALQPEVAHG